MIAGLLKNNSPGAAILVPILALVLWIPTLIHTHLPVEFDGMPLFRLVSDVLSSVNYLDTAVAVILIIGEAFLLNYIVIHHQITPKDNYLTAGLYVMVMSSSTSFLSLHPLIFANLFLILALQSVFQMHKKETAFPNAFDAGICISLASLFYLPALFFYPLLGLSFLIMRPFIWREWIISLMGLLLPYLFAAAYYLWKGDLLYLWNNKPDFTFAGKLTSANLPTSNYFFLTVFGILLFLAILVHFSSIGALSLKARSAAHVLFWFMVFAVVITIASPHYNAPYTAFIFIPAAALITNLLWQIKRNWWREFCFLLLLAAIIYNIML